MIKKHYVNPNSLFAKTIALSFYDGSNKGFKVQDLKDDLRRELFPIRSLRINQKNNEVDTKSISTYVYSVYLDELNNIRAIIFYSNVKKQYYCFKSSDPKTFNLRFQQNYASPSKQAIEDEAERTFKKKGVNNFDGVGNPKLIENINYFEEKFLGQIEPRIDKKSKIYRLISNETNQFSVDFVDKVKHKEISIVNMTAFESKVISLEEMGKLKRDRKDSVIINFETKTLDYFIYTYRPSVINHYLLFKNLGDNKYEFVSESISFNQLFTLASTKDISFRDANEFTSKSLAKKKYDEFLEQFIEFEEGEEFEEEFNDEEEFLGEYKEDIDVSSILGKELHKILSQYNYELDGNLVYFSDYETMPLAYIQDSCIKIRQNRIPKDVTFSSQIPLGEVNKIANKIKQLLQNKPSSRLVALEGLIDSALPKPFDQKNKKQLAIANAIEENKQSLWPTDKLYPEYYYNNLSVKYGNWVNNKPAEKKVAKAVVETIQQKSFISSEDADVGVTYHGLARIEERISSMSETEMIKLAKDAYVNGYNSVNFLEKDLDMFKYLQYKQNKYPGKTLRLYKNMIFIFSLEPPHDLVTCFPYEENFKQYKEAQKNRRH